MLCGLCSIQINLNTALQIGSHFGHLSIWFVSTPQTLPVDAKLNQKIKIQIIRAKTIKLAPKPCYLFTDPDIATKQNAGDTDLF